MVSFILTETCSSTKAEGADYNSSRSNKTHTSIFEPGGSTAAIQNTEMGLTVVFPNPAENVITVRADLPENFSRIEIMDMNGRVQMTEPFNSTVNQIGIQDLAAGVYYVKLVSEGTPVIHRIVKR